MTNTEAFLPLKQRLILASIYNLAQSAFVNVYPWLQNTALLCSKNLYGGNFLCKFYGISHKSSINPLKINTLELSGIIIHFF